VAKAGRGKDGRDVQADVALPAALYIYEPRGEAFEYGPVALNMYRGCGHACAYCDVPHAVHLTRAQFDAGHRRQPTNPPFPAP
jgi:hypothetical protein